MIFDGLEDEADVSGIAGESKAVHLQRRALLEVARANGRHPVYRLVVPEEPGLLDIDDLTDPAVPSIPGEANDTGMADVLSGPRRLEDDAIRGNFTHSDSQVLGAVTECQRLSVKAVGEGPPHDDVDQNEGKHGTGAYIDDRHRPSVASLFSGVIDRLDMAERPARSRRQAISGQIGHHLGKMTASLTVERVVDPHLPGTSALISTGVPAPMAAVYEAAGSTIDSVKMIQVTWWPGRHLTVRYMVASSRGALAGENQVVATVGRLPDGALVVEGPEGAVGVWVVPNDPLLPGLPSALDVPTVSSLLSSLGSNDVVTSTRLRSYRPGRRAVVEVRAGRSSIYLKVVRPSEVTALHERHRLLARHLAVPDSLGFSGELGILVMRAMSGVDLRKVLRGEGSPLPEAAAVAGVIQGLPEPPDHREARSSIESYPRMVDLLRRLVPEEVDRLDRISSAIGDETRARSVPAHGDFHEAQILVEGARPVGLLDVDTYGWGRPGDDPATMLGHLDLLARSCADPRRPLDLARGLQRMWDRSLDPVDLRLRTAAVVLGLASGPFRVQHPNWVDEIRARLALAEQWVQSAARVDERNLTDPS